MISKIKILSTVISDIPLAGNNSYRQISTQLSRRIPRQVSATDKWSTYDIGLGLLPGYTNREISKLSSLIPSTTRVNHAVTDSRHWQVLSLFQIGQRLCIRNSLRERVSTTCGDSTSYTVSVRCHRWINNTDVHRHAIDAVIHEDNVKSVAIWGISPALIIKIPRGGDYAIRPHSAPRLTNSIERNCGLTSDVRRKRVLGPNTWNNPWNSCILKWVLPSLHSHFRRPFRHFNYYNKKIKIIT